MENFILEIAEDEIERQAARCRDLDAGRRTLLSRIERAESARESVKEHIYHKVRQEYETQLQGIETELAPIAKALEQGRANIDQQIREIDIQTDELQDTLDELGFRHRLGELDERTLEDARTPLEEQHKRLAQRRGELSDMLSRIGADAAAPHSPGSRRSEDHPADRIERPDEPAGRAKSGSTATDAFLTEAGLDSTGTTLGSAKSDHDAPPEDPGMTEAFVDPTEWVGEFVRNDPAEENADLGSARDHPTASAAGVTGREQPGSLDPPEAEVSDPLASLADPWDDTTAPSDETAPQGTRNSSNDGEPAGLPILTISRGPGAGKRLPLLPVTMTLGREVDNNIELKDKDVARYHARISYESGRYVIQDLDGSSGTFVNGEQVTKTALSPGDLIRVGGTELTLDLG